jgi:hypothetical protein
MANKTALRTILDNDRYVTVLATGILDTGNVSATAAVDVSALTPPCAYLSLEEVNFSITSPLQVILAFDATTDVEAACLEGTGGMCYKDFGFLPDSRATGTTGDLLISTLGYASGSVSYSVLIKALKCYT